MGIHDRVEREGWIEPYIILYRDEYPQEVWENYCDLTDESYTATQIAIKITDVVAIYDGDNEE